MDKVTEAKLKAVANATLDLAKIPPHIMADNDLTPEYAQSLQALIYEGVRRVLDAVAEFHKEIPPRAYQLVVDETTRQAGERARQAVAAIEARKGAQE